MAGLFSSLALSTTVATQVVMGVQAPPAPPMEDQVIVQEAGSQDNTVSDIVKKSSPKRTTTQTVTVPPAPTMPTSKSGSKEEGSSEAEALEKSQDDGASNLSDLLSNEETAINSSDLVHGIDIASHQHSTEANIDIKTATANGQDFGFVKATEGTEYTNPHFRNDVIGFKNNDTPVGFYHYAKPSDSIQDAKEQAQFFMQKTGMDQGNIKAFDPVLDIEEDAGLTSEQLAEWVGAFVDEVKSISGRDSIIYTYQNFWRDKMGNTEEFSHLPLWIANYNNQATPDDLPGGWDNWTFWQYSAEGQIDGYSKDIDVNIFNGTEEDMKKMYKKGGAKKVGEDGKTTVTQTVVVAPPAPEL